MAIGWTYLQTKIHPVFHFSCLKLKPGQHIIPFPTLPPQDDGGHLVPKPVVVLQTKPKTPRSRTITEVVVQWLRARPKDATWELLYKLQVLFPHHVGKVL